MSGRLLLATVCAALLLSACNGSEPDPNPRASVESGGESQKAILPESALPDGWRYASVEDFLGIPQLCGVVLEPPKLSSAVTQRFATSSGDTFVIQYSFVSSDEKATTKRIDEFVSAASTCTEHEPTEGAKAEVTPLAGLTSVGDAFAAVRAVDASDATNKREYVVFRNGAHVTVLLSYGLGRVAKPADLDAMATAIDRRIASAG